MARSPVLSDRTIRDALIKLGVEIDRQRGSHIVLKRDTRTCVVPLDREVKKGTLAGILEQADVSRADLLAAL